MYTYLLIITGNNFSFHSHHDSPLLNDVVIIIQYCNRIQNDIDFTLFVVYNIAIYNITTVD